MILINVVYFIKTAVYCYKVKNEIHKMRGSIGDNKEAKQRKFKDDKEKYVWLPMLNSYFYFLCTLILDW